MKKITLILWLLVADSVVADSNVMEEVVVTATRSEKVLHESPYSVSLVTSEEIERFSQDQVADMIAGLPGVHISDAGQAGQKRIRIRGEDSRRVALLIDGQEFIDHREVGVPLLVDTNRVQRIEIVRGPASVLYGPKAMGGVINVITRGQREGPWNIDALATYNSATNGQNLSVQAAGQLDSWGWSIGGFDNDQGRRDTPAGEVENTEYANKGTNGELSFGMDDHSFAVAYDRYESASRIYVEPQIRFTPPFLDFQIDSPRRDREKFRADYAYTPLGTYFQSAKIDMYHQVSDREFNTVTSLMFAPGARSDTSIFNVSQLVSDGINLQSDFLISDSLSAIGGVQWISDEIDQVRNRIVAVNTIAGPASITNDIADLSSIAVYLQGEYEFSDQVSVLGGLRSYDVSGQLSASSHVANLPEFEDQNTIGTAALVVSVDESSYRLSWSEGYIYPSLLNLVVGAFAGSSFINPVADLVPEQSDTFELGYRYGGDLVTLDSVLFYTRAENYIDHQPCIAADNCAGIRDRIYRNVGEANSHGVELSLGIAFEQWQLDSSVTWMQREKKYEGVDTWDSGIPHVTGYISGRYRSSLWDKPMLVSLTTRFETQSRELVATRTGFATEENAGFGVSDLEVHYALSEASSLTLVAANLMDKAYSSATENLLAPGRHLRMKFKFSL